jgi:aspartyl-tRNA(Asn)/glutamyl-tRNA(Gln) amidotransferase subunit A
MSRRIEADNPKLNAFITVMADEAMRRAREADQDLAAATTTSRCTSPSRSRTARRPRRADHGGPRVREGHVAQHDAATIAHLRMAGAVLVGKTNLHEFAFGTTSEDSAFGPVRNPHDPTRSAGGSSGGSAVSVAAGMALATIGTDTGGSIRIPAAACGIVGPKPTLGEVSIDGVVPLSRTLDHVGPLAQTVTDACLVYHALIGDAHAQPPAPMPMHGLRLAVPRTYFCDLLDDEVRARFEEALDRLRTAGAHIDEVEIHHAADIAPVYLHLVLGDAAAYHATTLETMPERYTTPVRIRLEMGRYVLAEDYARALAGRERLRREVDAALSQHDALILPSLPIPAPPIGANSVQVGTTAEPVRNLMLRLTQPFNITGHPAIAMPSGVTKDKLPCSVQLVGRRMQTDALLRAALACENQISDTASKYDV